MKQSYNTIKANIQSSNHTELLLPSRRVGDETTRHACSLQLLEWECSCSDGLLGCFQLAKGWWHLTAWQEVPLGAAAGDHDCAYAAAR